MGSKKRVLQNKVNIGVFVAGLLSVLFMGVPYLILGQEAIVVYHDQLDGELIAYLLQAKHLLEGDTFPEFMNGVYKTSLTAPAPAFVLLFLVLDGFSGLVCMQVLGSVCGYVGMYLLVKKVAEDAAFETWHKAILPLCACATAVLYAYLPFLPVYGLAQYGLPLLLWCLLQAKSGKYVKTAYGIGVIYVLCSSLVLVGFGVLGVMAVWILWCFWKKRSERKKNIPVNVHPGHLTGIWGTMLVLYIIENFSLLKQTFAPGSAEQAETLSHKAEYVLYPDSFASGLVEGFTKGGQHSVDYHNIFLVVVLGMLIVGLVFTKSKLSTGNQFTDNQPADRNFTCKKLIFIIGICVGCNFVFASVAALWDCTLGIALRSKLSALGAFQMNRLLWLAPCLWYLSFACAVLLACELVKITQGKKRIVGSLCCVLSVALLGAMGVKVLLESNLKPNIQKLRNSEYAAISFKDYYAIGVLEQVEAYIRETTGERQEDYRVVSLGIDPAAALYHGFYCLDGYSNNYPLSYKHSFRSIIEPELNKNAYLKENFDGWGNRCYLFSAECPGYYTVEKGGFYYQNYSLNTEALKAMGGKYLLSAAYIANAEETGLKLLREEAFETGDSYYRIFLYEVE